MFLGVALCTWRDQLSIIELTQEEAKELRRRVAAPATFKRDSLRASIVLRRAEGVKQTDTARELNVSIPCVNKWSQRFERDGLDGLPGRGRKPSIPPETVEKVIAEAGKEPESEKRWSVRTMAAEVGISPDSVFRIWKANDKNFEEEFWDVIGLYLNPPERGLVLCCDEKSRFQALERTQPALTLGVGGHLRTRTHDYIRHGTITLFAALTTSTAFQLLRA